jgi:signal transduction histidine kinase/DNA-binding NarL/FixJ family response regulator
MGAIGESMAASSRPAPPPKRPGEPGTGPLQRLASVPSGVSVLVLILVAIWAAVLGYLVHQHRQAEHDAYEVSANLARGFGESVARTMEAMDQVFAMLRAFHRADPAGFDIQALAPKDGVLTDLTLQIAVVNADGMMRGSNLGGPPVDLSDREHIRVHLDRPGDFLFVSKPVLGRVSKKWSIQLTRKFFHPDGALAGVIVISLDPDYFARFYASFNAPGGAIALVGLDGVFRARAPRVEAAQPVVAAPATMALLRGPADTGTWRAASQIDGVDRLYAFRRLDKYGLAVTVGLAASEVFAEFNRQVVLFVAIGIGISGLVVMFGRSSIRAGQRLRESQRALSATLENMNQGIMMVDANGHVPVINRRAVALLDLPPGIARLGTTFGAILQWQIDRREFAAQGSDIDVDALARTGGLGPAVYERQRPNGTVLEVQTRELPGGGAVRTYTDITERKRTEQALAAARDAAEEALKLRAEFVATMSHEIRTPLNAVIGMAGLLIDDDLPPHLRRYAATLRDAAETLLQVIDDILDFSRLDAERMELDEIAFDLPALLASVVDLMEVKAAEKKLALRLSMDAQDMPAPLPRLVGDPGRLRQVVMNLVANGLKFTEAGSVAIEATMLPLAAGTVLLRVAVTDTGPGIEEAAQARLFEPFTQVDGSISRRYGGSGLGLAICRRLLARMGGTIAVRSRPGAGSSFAFEVTLRVDASPVLREAEAAPAPHRAPTRRLRILLAEDNATNRMVAVTRLEAMGHRVDAVAGGADAIESVQSVPYDLVLMDVMMPEVDGLAATRAIRALGGKAGGIPIVAVTANVFRSHQEACRAAGMDDFLPKPITQPALERILLRAQEGTLRRAPAGPDMETPQEALARLGAEFGAATAQEVAAGFIAEARAAVAGLDAGGEAGRRAAAAVLRDAAETLGLAVAARLAARLEVAAPGEDGAIVAAIRANLQALEDALAAPAQPGRAQPSRLR